MMIDGCDVSTFWYAMLKVAQVSCMALATYAWRSTKLFEADFRVVILGAFAVYQLFKYSDALGAHLVGGPWRTRRCISWIGIDDICFDAAGQLLDDITAIILVLLCRGQRTGSLYLLLLSVTGVAGSLGAIECEYLGAVWPITSDQIKNGEYSMFIKLQFLATSLSLLAAPFFWLMLPGTRTELRDAFERTPRPASSRLVAAANYRFLMGLQKHQFAEDQDSIALLRVVASITQ